MKFGIQPVKMFAAYPFEVFLVEQEDNCWKLLTQFTWKMVVKEDLKVVVVSSGAVLSHVSHRLLISTAVECRQQEVYCG